MGDRANSHWVVPPGLEAGANEAVIKLKIDAAGVIHDEELVASDDERLGQSALAAVQAAAPFPPLNDNNRCLTALRISITMNRSEL